MEPTTVTSGWRSSEFWASIGALAASIITLVVLFGFIKPQDQESVTKAVSEVIAAIGAIVVQWGVARTYTSNRTDLKLEAMRMNAVRTFGPEAVKALANLS